MSERRRLPDVRESVTRRFQVPWREGNQEPLKVYVVVGLYEDGCPGEIFIKCDKAGSLVSGAFDATALMMSIALQHGAPLATLTSKLRGMQFEPRGMTGDKEFPTAQSVLDLVARWMESKWVTP